MKTKVGDTAEVFNHFLENAPKNILKDQAIIITNGVWDIHIDYNGENYEEGLRDLKLLATARPHLIKLISASKNVNQILYSIEELAGYFEHRNFTVSLKAKNSFVLDFLLRARVWLRAIF
jgi:hypothetical protein